MDNNMNIIEVDEKEIVEYVVKSLVMDNDIRNDSIKMPLTCFYGELENMQYSNQELMHRLMISLAREEVYKYKYEKLYNQINKNEK